MGQETSALLTDVGVRKCQYKQFQNQSGRLSKKFELQI